LILTACDSSDNDQQTNFNITTLLTDATNQQIIPAVDAFLSEVTLLDNSIINYLDNTTTDNLTSVKSQWKTVALSYEKIYAFNIGDIRNQFSHQAIYPWPTVPTSIEDFIVNNTEITETFISSLSPQVKSIAALEYLMYKSDITTTNSEFINETNRRDFLKFASANLKSEAERVANTWAASGANYSQSFINNSASGINGSFNIYFNGLYNLIDTGKVSKIGKPAGLENSQTVNPELTQAFYSNTSKDIIKANMLSIQNAYFNTQGLGIDDYVFSIMNNQELNDLVQNKINDVTTAVDNIPVPLYDAVTSNPNEVATLHAELEALGILFAVDLRSILSIVITSTDNDGD
jgi:predicted lipoprotein